MKHLLLSILLLLAANTLSALGQIPDYSEYTVFTTQKNGWIPVQAGIGWVRLAPMSYMVLGMNTDFLYSCQSCSYGISLAPVLLVGKQIGLGISGWQRICGTNTGLVISGAVYCIKNQGVVFSLWNRLNRNHGVAIGLVNTHSATTSLYYGPYHSMDLTALELSDHSSNGIQIGLWNSAASGIQIGLLNYNRNSGLFPWFPLINFSWRRK